MTLILMMTGGNSGSTAGGAKTTTILLVLLTAASILKGEENVHIFGRRIENDLLRRACSIVVVYFTMGMLATLAICAVQPEFTLQQVLIEVFSGHHTRFEHVLAHCHHSADVCRQAGQHDVHHFADPQEAARTGAVSDGQGDYRMMRLEDGVTL